MKEITVFTPTFNRANTIIKLYQSLLRQSNEIEFEWLVIDDGSSDNTEELITTLKKENKKFDIIYVKQENAGKHVAINKGVELANGELFFIVDSDDYLTDEALVTIKKWRKTLNNSEEKFGGIAGLKETCKGEMIGTTFEDKYLDATSLERNKFNIKGDKAEVFFTKILKDYKFPVFENEKFMSEAYIWNKIAIDGYKLRWFNEVLMICDYREDGLTKNRNKLELNNPKGLLIYLKQLIDTDKRCLGKIAHYSSYLRIAKRIYTNKEIKEQLGISCFKLYIYNIIYKLRNLWRKK